MSHMGILDMIGRLFVNLVSWIGSTTTRQSNCKSVGVPGSATPATVSCGEDCQERDFDRECFVNIAIQVIAQLFETPDALQDFDCAESACLRRRFFSRT